jgi:hypothetical protein
MGWGARSPSTHPERVAGGFSAAPATPGCRSDLRKSGPALPPGNPHRTRDRDVGVGDAVMCFRECRRKASRGHLRVAVASDGRPRNRRGHARDDLCGGSVQSIDNEPLARDRPVSHLMEPEVEEPTDTRPRWRELDEHIREVEAPERFFEQDVTLHFYCRVDPRLQGWPRHARAWRPPSGASCAGASPTS